MPVILEPKDYDRWLDPSETERPPVDLLRPFPDEQMKAARELNPAINNVHNNAPEMLNSK